MQNFSTTVKLLFTCNILILSACGSAPKPLPQIASAKTAIAAAEKIQASKYAIVELDRAQNKLILAEKTMQKGNNEEARRLAEQALAEAEYASAKTVATRVTTGAKEMEDSIHILKQQMQQQ